MSKRNLILLSILLIIFALVLYVARAPKIEVVEDTPESGNFFSNFFSNLPNILKNNGVNIPINIGGGQDEEEGDVVESKLRKVSDLPVAGFGLIEKEVYSYVAEPEINTEKENEVKHSNLTIPNTEKQLYIQYIIKQNGNIYQGEPGNSDERKHSEQIMPVIQEAFVGKNGSSIIMRYLTPGTETIETFIRLLPEENIGADIITNSKVDGRFLPQNIRDLSLSKDGNSILYLQKTQEGVTGFITEADGINKKNIFESHFTEWLTQWPNEDLITLNTKPASGIPGYLYSVNTKIKDFKKIVGGINGLTTLTSPNGLYVLIGDDSMNLSILNRDTGEIKDINIQSLPEKCTWDKSSYYVYCGVPQYKPAGKIPDDWYKGKISFNDNIWKIQPQTGEAGMLINILKNNENIDTNNLKISPDSNFLYFIDKQKSILWELKLN